MQLGIHLIRRPALATLVQRGVDIPQPWIGILDLVRTIEGFAAEPADSQAIGVVGLDALLKASGDDAPDLLRFLRAKLIDARRYFERHEIPVCLLVEGVISSSVSDGARLNLNTDRDVLLTPLLGRSLEPVGTHIPEHPNDWWWTPQLG